MIKNMYGKDHAMSKMLDNADSDQIVKLMGWVQKFSPIFRAIAFLYRNLNVILILIIAWLVYFYVL